MPRCCWHCVSFWDATLALGFTQMISLIEFELKFDFFFILYKKTKNIPDCGERLWVCLREIRTAYCSSNIGPIASRGGAEAVERLCPEGGGHSPICQSSGSVWALLSHTGFGIVWCCCLYQHLDMVDSLYVPSNSGYSDSVILWNACNTQNHSGTFNYSYGGLYSQKKIEPIIKLLACCSEYSHLLISNIMPSIWYKLSCSSAIILQCHLMIS